jgi:hypothetical protein
MSPGQVLSDSFALYRAHWRHLIPVALVLYVILSLITLLLGLVLGWLGLIASVFVSIVGFFWLQGALVEAVADVRDGRADLSIGETFARVRPRLAALISAGILAALAIVVGLALLIVPGLILLTWWCLIAPVIVLEGAGAGDSFGRSRELVRGNGWAVFATIVLTIVVVAVVETIVGAILSTVFTSWLGNYLSSVVVNSIGAPFVVIAFTLMYFRLRGPEPVPAQVGPSLAG